MSYQVLARKWRPAQFDQVVGQKHIVAALSNALDQDRVHHAFLFTGTRGVGKTTLARIFAKALNCEQGVSSTPCGECAACVAVAEGRFIDLIEVDAASRTKVDDTRELLENVQYAPTQGRYKIYLIDEVHMLSTHSFNALLKTLEEPPGHVKFLLATTDPQKLPMTVLSRCIQFSLNAIELQAIEKQLGMILQSEEIAFEPTALSILARGADGSLRDALSLLDQAIAYSDQRVSESAVRKMLGLIEGQSVVDILYALAENDIDSLMEVVAQLTHAAQDLKTALDDLLSYLHTLALYQFAPDAVTWKGADADQLAKLADLYPAETLQLYYQIVLNGKRDFALAPDARTGFEMILLRLAAFKPASASENLTKAAPKTGISGAEQGGIAQARKSLEKPKKTIQPETQQQVPRSSRDTDETADSLLENGLQNEVLRARLQPASSLSRNSEPVTESEHVTPAVAEPESQSDEKNNKHNINELISNINAWSDFMLKSGLSGMARQLAMHMQPLGFESNRLKLKLDQRYANLQSADRMARITEVLQQTGEQAFAIGVELGEVESAQTAAGVIAERERLNLEKTRQEFKEDENVKELMTQFNAEVDDSSIKPVN